LGTAFFKLINQVPEKYNKSMIEKIIAYNQRKKRIRLNNSLIKKGVLQVGKNTKIDNLEISIATELKDNLLYIVIGEDSIIHGKIVLYNTNSKVIIGNRVYMGPDTTLFCNCNITIEDDILFSWGITLIDTNAHSVNFAERKNDVLNWKQGLKDWSHVSNAPILIKSKSWIGFNTIITKGVTIGEEAIVGCGSVVVKNVEDKTVVGGNPAEIIR
jgi:galactoside O-acetyltransferase